MGDVTGWNLWPPECSSMSTSASSAWRASCCGGLFGAEELSDGHPPVDGVDLASEGAGDQVETEVGLFAGGDDGQRAFAFAGGRGSDLQRRCRRQ